MSEKAEMRLGEWLVQLLCKLIAFGAAMAGLWGLLTIAMQAILPMLDRQAYGGAACVMIACIAVLYGLSPLAVGVDKALLRLCGGKMPFPRYNDK